MSRQPFIWLSVLVVLTTAALVAQTPNPSFEVASVKKWIPGPGGAGIGFRQANGAFDRARTTVVSLIEFAFELQEYQVVGGPDWIRRDNFEVLARGDKAATLAQIRLMVQALLRDRFMLRTRNEKREMATYVLSLAREDSRLGPGLRPASDPMCRKEVNPPRVVPAGAMTGRGCSPIVNLAYFIGALLRSPVVDETALNGPYEWSFYHSRDGLITERPIEPGVAPPAADPSGLPSLASALREQLGLNLEFTRAPIKVLVIDSIQQPTEN